MTHIVVLASNRLEASEYIKRAGLPKGRAVGASSAHAIEGVTFHEIHELPGFAKRRDRHAVESVLRRGRKRYAKVERIQVTMPPKPDPLLEGPDVRHDEVLDVTSIEAGPEAEVIVLETPAEEPVAVESEPEPVASEFEAVHTVGPDGQCRISLNGQGHFPCGEHGKGKPSQNVDTPEEKPGGAVDESGTAPAKPAPRPRKPRAPKKPEVKVTTPQGMFD